MIKLTAILRVTDRKLNKLDFLITLLFILLFAFPLFPFHFTNSIFMLLSIFTLIAYFIKPFNVIKIILLNLVFVIPFVPYLVEFCISNTNYIARFEFEKKLFFFTAPLIIPIFIKITGFKNYKVALMVFSFSMVLLTIYTVIYLFINNIPFSPKAYENGSYIFRDYFEHISGLHPTYYSIFALLASCFLLHPPSFANNIFKLICKILAGILFISIIFVASKIALFTLVIFILMWIIRSKSSFIKKFIFIFLALFLVLISSILVPSLKNRLGEIISFKKKQLYNNTIFQRNIIIDCSLEVFSENILTGTGSENFQQKLNDCYTVKGWHEGASQNFNPHNQYLLLGINYGIMELIFFGICLFLIFRNIYTFPEGKYFMVAIIFFFFTESILERQMGVYFFGLISLLLYNVNLESNFLLNLVKLKIKHLNN